MKPYYEDDQVVIYNGKCEDIVPNISNFELIVTDPPYGISHPCNFKSRGRGKLAECNDYPDVFGDTELFDPQFLLSFQKPTVLWGANYFADKLPLSSGWLVWDKERPDGLDQSTCELAWTNYVKGVRRFKYLWNGMMRAGEKGQNFHPTQKPIALIQWIFSLKWTPPGAVLDPYMGAGSTLVAAKYLGRKAIGIEIEESYCEIAVKRVSQCSLKFNFSDEKETVSQETFIL